jgi:parallel beta-helix repeat protein
MPRIVDQPPSTHGPWKAILVSLLAFAAVMAAAAYLPNWLAPTRLPDSPAAAGLPTDAAAMDTAQRQAVLVEGEDQRLLDQLPAMPWAVPAYVDRSHGGQTTVLTARPTPYDLASLVDLGAAKQVDRNTVDLITSVLIAPGARLVLDCPGTTFRLTSTPDGFVSLVGWKGSLVLAGQPGRPITVTSWDPATASADSRVEDGRAYVRVVGGDLHSSFAELSHLGFWSGRTGGLALTGGPLAPATGSIADTTVRAGYYGLFSTDTQRLLVSGSSFLDNAADGVLLHRGSKEPIVRATTAISNGGNGVAAGRGAATVTLQGVTAEHNGENGILLDGRALVDHPGPSGHSVVGHRGFRAENSRSRFNVRNGILAWDTEDMILARNLVEGNAEGIVVRGATTRGQIDNNTVTASAGAAVAVRGGSEVVVQANTISGASYGIQVRNAQTEVLRNNVDGARLHAVSFQQRSHGSSAVLNTLAGSGPSALDLLRLDTAAKVEVFGNSEEHWQVNLGAGERLRRLVRDHPLLGMWATLLLIPVMGTMMARVRRSRQRDLQPYSAVGDIPAALIHRAPAAAEVVQPMDTEPSSTRVSMVGFR